MRAINFIGNISSPFTELGNLTCMDLISLLKGYNESYLQPVTVDKQLPPWQQPALVAVLLRLYIFHPFPSHSHLRNASIMKQRQELHKKRFIIG